MKIDEIKNLKEQLKVYKQAHENQQKLIELQEINISMLQNDLRHEKELNSNLLSSYDKQKELFTRIRLLTQDNMKYEEIVYKVRTVAIVGEDL